jgi:hypothetical protein
MGREAHASLIEFLLTNTGIAERSGVGSNLFTEFEDERNCGRFFTLDLVKSISAAVGERA